MAKKLRLAPAADGCVARVMDPWTQEKLHYVARYLDIFCTAMKDKWTLVYGDFLAGPGLCIDLDTHQEAPGSPLLAIRRPEFRRVHLNDAAPAVAAALANRTSAEPPERIMVTNMDCNEAVDSARAFLFPPNRAGGCLGLAVIDPTAFQMRFDSLVKLTRGLRMDLIVIFMSGFIKRFIGTKEYERRVMDDFFGTPTWRTLLMRKHEGERLTFRHLLDLYEQQLKNIGYVHVDDSQNIRNSQGSTIYHIISASKHSQGADFFRKVSQQAFNGQRRLFA